MSAEHDPELTNNTTEVSTKYPFSQYKSTKTTSLEAVKIKIYNKNNITGSMK